MENNSISNEQRARILKNANMKMLSEQKAPKLTTEEEKVMRLDALIEKAERIVEALEYIHGQHQEFLSENHHVPKKASDVSILIGKNRFAGKMKLQK